MAAPQFSCISLLAFVGLIVSHLPCAEAHYNATFVHDWMPEPKSRGTLRLLSSCLVTLGLCVWTTVHVNIEPDQLNTTLSRILPRLQNKAIDRFIAKRWVRKMGWSLVALFVPEATVCIALHELKTAMLLREQMLRIGQNMGEQRKEGEEMDRVLQEWRERWSELSVSYFVVMGGFRVANDKGDRRTTALEPLSPDTSDSKRPLSPAAPDSERPKDTLTPHGFVFLAEQLLHSNQLQKLPPINDLQLRDRSKAGKLAKAIVIYQAVWMVLQGLSRTATGVTVTMLELHVILHVLCSLAMYAVWWDKPMDIDLQETVSVGDDLEDKLRKGPSEGEKDPTNAFRHQWPRKKKEDATGDGTALREHPITTAEGTTPKVDAIATAEGTTPKVDAIATAEGIPPRDETTTAEADLEANREPTISTASANQYLTSRAGLGKLLYLQLRNDKEGYFSILESAYDYIIESKKWIWKEALFLSFIGVAYGGSHLATWNNRFPSLTEVWMWRISSLVTAVSMGGLFILMILGAYVPGLKRKNAWFRRFCGFTFGLGLLPAVVARIFLFVECFISLRTVPEDVYKLPRWAETWPHV